MGFGLGNVLSLGSSIAGSFLGGRSEQAGADAALGAAQPFNVRSPFGSVSFSGGNITQRLGRGLDRAQRFNTNRAAAFSRRIKRFNIRDAEDAAFQRFQELTRPEQERRRAAITNRQFQSGRLGLGTPQPRTGGFANPELAALAEGEAFEGSILAQQAFEAARTEERRLIDNYFRFLSGELGVAQASNEQARLGIAARNPAGIAGLQGQVGFNNARRIEAFTGALGSSFSTGGGSPFRSSLTGGGRV